MLAAACCLLRREMGGRRDRGRWSISSLSGALCQNDRAPSIRGSSRTSGQLEYSTDPSGGYYREEEGRKAVGWGGVTPHPQQQPQWVCISPVRRPGPTYANLTELVGPGSGWEEKRGEVGQGWAILSRSTSRPLFCFSAPNLIPFLLTPLTLATS